MLGALNRGMERAPAGTYWVPVGDGAVLAGPHPVLAPEGLEDRLERLQAIGIVCFVDLSSSDDWMPGYRELLKPGVEYLRYPIRDRWLPPDAPALLTLLRAVIDEANLGRMSYFHCQAGLGRTGTVVGCLLRELGLTGEQALDEIIRLRMECGLHEGSPEFEEQREYIRDWSVGLAGPYARPRGGFSPGSARVDARAHL
jgi:protein-tyrosine phosphatase